MARAKKVEDKPQEGATIQIDVASFLRTRDSVVTGLATLQDAIQTLSTAYIKHTNAVLGEHGTGLEVDSALAKLGANPLFQALGESNRAATPAASAPAEAAAAGDKKPERKKRQHDPNAPKRPLTPFFLYMQTARPIISADLGPDFPKGAVSTEGTRRWSAMADADKQLWTGAYKDNLRLYNARMHSYKNGNPNAKDMTDQEATIYAEEHNVSNDASADAQIQGEAAATALNDEDADGEPDKEPTPPPKTPKAKGGRKGKAAPKAPTPAETPAVPETIVPPASASIVPPKSVEKEKSPDKKRKRASKKGVAEDTPTAPAPEKEEMAVETPKSAPKPRKKKAKSDA